MLHSLNLDQLRIFVTIADYGSFSEAGRRLYRSQSVMSNAILNLENILGVKLFDRSGWRPTLTEHGKALLIDARSLLARVEQFKSRAQGMAGGLEAELSLVLDVMFPAQKLVRLATAFRQHFPGVALLLHIDVLGGVPERVLSGKCDLGVQGSLPDIAPELIAHALPEVAIVPVAAHSHALASLQNIDIAQLQEHTQIVLTDYSAGTQGRTFSVYSEQQILTTDLGAKHAMLRAGLGWGFMPHSFVAEDIAAGHLCELDLLKRNARNRRMPLFAVHLSHKELGPAGRWVLNWLATPE